MRKFIIFVLIFLSINVFAKGEVVFPDYLPVRALAMSGAHRASATKTDAAYVNPAALISLGKKYIVDLSWQYGGDFAPNNISTSVIDTKTSDVAGGLYFNYFSKDISVEGQEKDDTYDNLQAGLSYAYLISGGLVFGVNGKYFKYQKNDENYLHTATLDLGFVYHFSQYVKLAIVGYNLTYIDKPEAPLQLATGVMVGDDESISINFDVVADFSAPDFQKKDATALYKYQFGAKITPIFGLSFMGGYQIDNISKQNFWSVGGEYLIPETRMEFLVGYTQSTSEDNNKIIGTSIRLYF